LVGGWLLSFCVFVGLLSCFFGWVVGLVAIVGVWGWLVVGW